MEGKRRGKVIFRSGSTVLKIVVMVLIVFTMAALVALRWVHNGIQEQTADMRAEAAVLEQENTDLEDRIGQLGSVKSVEDIAREELDLVNPDTIVIDVQP